MINQHFVRVGDMGHVGRFTPVDAVRYPRGTRVICRTRRGLETGHVLAPVEASSTEQDSDGLLLRGMTAEDHLLVARLEKYRQRAFRACHRMLVQRGISTVLMDVEHLFDGESLYFYFLGEVTPEIESLTGELASIYDAKIQLRRFAETLTHGCGPGCGTEKAAGGGCGDACTSCAVAAACGSRDPTM